MIPRFCLVVVVDFDFDRLPTTTTTGRTTTTTTTGREDEAHRPESDRPRRAAQGLVTLRAGWARAARHGSPVRRICIVHADAVARPGLGTRSSRAEQSFRRRHASGEEFGDLQRLAWLHSPEPFPPPKSEVWPEPGRDGAPAPRADYNPRLNGYRCCGMRAGVLSNRRCCPHGL
jgi:hypothetical protein